MYRHQGYSFLMKANDSRCGSVFGQQIARESILGPLCLCCAPNMICTCLLLCCLQSWAWPALSGGLCQQGNLCGAVKCCIRTQNPSSINKLLCHNEALFLLQQWVLSDCISCKSYVNKTSLLSFSTTALLINSPRVIHFETLTGNICLCS